MPSLTCIFSLASQARHSGDMTNVSRDGTGSPLRIRVHGRKLKIHSGARDERRHAAGAKGGFMWQAEIAGGRVTSTGELPTKGRLLRAFELVSASGRVIQLSDYRGRSNLVLVFTDHKAATAQLLTEMAQRYEEFKREEAEIVAVAKCSREACGRIKGQLKLPFPVLSDEDGRLHHEFGASDQQGNAAAAYVTDRYAEVFAVYRTRDGQTLPRAAEILQWLEFINSQCPECEPPEWPA